MRCERPRGSASRLKCGRCLRGGSPPPPVRLAIRERDSNEAYRLTGPEVADRIRDVGLGDELGKRYKSLSGGQQQRLSLLIAVIHQPVLLLLDEPTSGLDPQSRRHLWDRIENLRTDGGGILLTTHSMEEAQAVCDRVAIIDHGRLLAVDTPAGLIAEHRDDPRVRKVARGDVTLEDVFIGLTGSDVRG